MRQHEKSLPFPATEYRSRLARVREKAARLGVDALLIHSPENTYYLTGFRTLGYSIYQALLVPLSDEPAFVTRTYEATSSVPGTSNLKEVIGYDDAENPLEMVRSLLIKWGLGKALIGIDESSRNLTCFQYRLLRRLCRPARFVDCSGLVESVRLIKSPAEFTYIRQAARASREGVLAGIRATRPGATENDVAAEAYRALITNGSEYPGYPPFIPSGPRSGLAHSSWERRKVRRGEIVLLEVSASIMRYHAPMARTVVAGKPSQRLARIGQAVCDAFESAVGAMRAGARSGDVNEAAHAVIDQAGFGPFFDRITGYSIGVAFPPTWSEARTVPHYVRRSRLAAAGIDGRRFYLSRNNPSRLEAGMVFHVVPGILIPGFCNVMTSGTVAVKEDGAEVLNDMDRRLFIR